MIFKNSFQSLPTLFYEPVKPTPLVRAKLVAISKSCQEMLGLKLTPNEMKSWLNGETRLEGDQQISTRYSGHQFGVWAGQLGDGRAISLGEIVAPSGRWEIQTKGSGLTPFSRMGDGKAVIRSSVREFVISEAMHYLGIPTTRALALLTGDDSVERETIERSGLVARVFPSNLRFGHFEHAYHFNHLDELKSLTSYTQAHFFPECKNLQEMLTTVTQQTARLIAQWQSLGFCHGVMNTDNMSFLGLTMDYGPFGFMENYDPEWICNHSDHGGRYSYINQPYIGIWNLDRLMICFSDSLSAESLKEILMTYEPAFYDQYYKEFAGKLGFKAWQNQDVDLLQSLLTLMQEHSLDFTYTFRQLPTLADQTPGQELPLPLQIWKTQPALQDWLKKYRIRLSSESTTPLERFRSQNLKNPKYILRNYIAQEIISEVELGKFEKLEKWMQVFEKPYDEHPEFNSYAEPTPEALRKFIISCSS